MQIADCKTGSDYQSQFSNYGSRFTNLVPPLPKQQLALDFLIAIFLRPHLGSLNQLFLETMLYIGRIDHRTAINQITQIDLQFCLGNWVQNDPAGQLRRCARDQKYGRFVIGLLL